MTVCAASKHGAVAAGLKRVADAVETGLQHASKRHQGSKAAHNKALQLPFTLGSEGDTEGSDAASDSTDSDRTDSSSDADVL